MTKYGTPVLWMALIAAPICAQRDAVSRLLAERYADDAPGCAVAVVKDGRVIDTYYRGLADTATGKKIDAQSRFYLASVSKQFTATCAHLLIHDGKLGLDDDVRKYVPELPDYGDVITVRHLIHHRSGLRDYLELMVLAGMDIDEPHTVDEVLALLARQKALNFRPGSEFLYCNTGYLLLSEIVARVSGKSMRVFANERLFGPLGMNESEFRDEPDQQIENAVVGHQRSRPRPTQFHLVGSGGLVAPATDLARWVVALERGQPISKDFVASLHKPIELTADQGRNPMQGHYAAGWLLGNRNGLPLCWHPGGSFGFKACLLHFPTQRLGVVVLTNASEGNAERTAFEVAEQYLASPPAAGEKVESVPVAASSEGPEPRHGRFFFTHPRTDELVVAIVQPGKAKLAVPSWDAPMASQSGSAMVSTTAAIPVHAKFLYRDGAPADLRVTVGKQTPFVCKGFAMQRTAQAQLDGLAGIWQSAELGGAKFELKVGRGQVELDGIPLLVDGPLFALRPDLLVTNEALQIGVARDAEGEPVELRLSTKGARGIVFTR